MKFGGTNATSFTVTGATSITATAPAGTGTVDVTVTSIGGTSAVSAGDKFTYIAAPTVASLSPTSGPTAGGTGVTISGTGFTGASAVKFGAANVTSFTVASATSITATAPAGSGTVDVTVTTRGGTSAAAASDKFTYVPRLVAHPVSAGVAFGSTNDPIALNITGGTAVSVAVASAAAHGTATASGTAIAYTPAPGYVGADSFSYTATNPGGTSSSATVTITVGAPAVPVVAAKSVTTPYDTATAIDLSGSITGVDVTAVTVATAPGHGTTAVSGKVVTYTPSATFYGGTDSFSYTATNPGGRSRPATVTVTVGKPAPPVAVADKATTPGDQPVAIAVTANDTGIITSVAVAGSPAHGTAAATGTAITYTPAMGFAGSDSFTYRALGPGGSSAPATVSVTVTPLAVPIVGNLSETVTGAAPLSIDPDGRRHRRPLHRRRRHPRRMAAPSR